MTMSVTELLGPGYEYAQELLNTAGGFPPFVIVLDVLDQRKVLVSEDGTVETLRNIVTERYRRDVPKVLALFSEVRVSGAEFGEEAQRAIAVHVDVYAGLNKLVITPVLEDDGRWELGQPHILEATERLIRRE